MKDEHVKRKPPGETHLRTSLRRETPKDSPEVQVSEPLDVNSVLPQEEQPAQEENATTQEVDKQNSQEDLTPRAIKVGSYAVDIRAQPEAIVFYCSDPRFQSAFGEFIEHELELGKGRFIPFVVAGSVSSLINPLKLPKEFKFVKERLEFFMKHFPGIRRIVLINHEDCGYFAEIRTKFKSLFSSTGAKNLVEQHKNGLAAVAKVLKEFLPVRSPVQIELYYARFEGPEHKSVVFEKVFAV